METETKTVEIFRYSGELCYIDPWSKYFMPIPDKKIQAMRLRPGMKVKVNLNGIV